VLTDFVLYRLVHCKVFFGWALALEADFERRRAEFTRRVGDINAPISADHVYMYIHQTGMRRDDDLELEWHREREIAKIEQMWEGEPELPPEHPDQLDSQAGGTG